ncbi:MAG: hypothetical protein CM15mV56_170 [uncultured marine virus]|nr:MAG: hypothetical protein CM15mV56_170 [uncultured marine virus]
MDILDDFPVEEQPMEPELVSEFMVMIKDLKRNVLQQKYITKDWLSFGRSMDFQSLQKKRCFMHRINNL